MKKIFFAICAVLPGGFLFLVVMLLFTGCAHTRYDRKTGERVVEGFGSIVEISIAEQIQAEAEAIRAQADATRMCSADVRFCGALWGPWGAYGHGAMNTEGGGYWGWPSTQNFSQDIKKVKGDINDLKRAQEKQGNAIIKIDSKSKKKKGS